MGTHKGRSASVYSIILGQGNRKEFENKTDTGKIAKVYRMGKSNRHGTGDDRDCLGNTSKRGYRFG